jgi:hypothetical protein
MDIDKSLSQAPMGLGDMPMPGDQPALEIEIKDPEELDIRGPGFALHMEEDDEEDDDFSKNLAEDMDESELMLIANELIGDYDNDISSRKDWIQTYVDGLELLGLKIEERAEPWEGACGVYHPLLSEDRKSVV